MTLNNTVENKKKIAVTGGIGSGKTTVMGIIQSEGYGTVSFDEIYHELLYDEKFVIDICSIVGVKPKILNGKKVLDRAAVSEKVFNNHSLLEKLNAFTHAKITVAAFKKGDSLSKSKVFYEVPLLFESKLESLFDKVIVVMRDRNDRISAAAKRDGCLVEETALRAKNQFDYEKNDLSLHIVIINDGDIESLKSKVRKVLNEIK